MTIAKWSLLLGSKGMVGKSKILPVSSFVQQAKS
jgi:hypothetical protein